MTIKIDKTAFVNYLFRPMVVGVWFGTILGQLVTMRLAWGPYVLPIRHERGADLV